MQRSLNDVETREISHVAALDLGSNSFHLVVARIVADSVQILHTIKQKVRLAEGLDEHDNLSEQAIERGLETLSQMSQSLQGFSPDSVRIVATHTLRRAKNAMVFIKAARKILPCPVEVISGVEEARLIYMGVAHTSHEPAQKLVVDIGGGSTEFVIGEGFNPMLLRSLRMGCVSYTQRFFADGNISKKRIDKAVTYAEQKLELIEKSFRAMGWQSCIGTSGTIRTLLDVAIELSGDSQKTTLEPDDLKAIIRCCDKARSLDKLKLAGLTDERQPVFVAGLVILTAIFSTLGIKQMSYSTAALREGVIYEMEDGLSRNDICQRTAESLATRYDVDIQQASRVLNTTLALYKPIKKDWGIGTRALQNVLSWAALLHEVGLQINSRAVQRHSAYILQNVELPGFNQEQQDLLAMLVRFHRKKIRRSDIVEFEQYATGDIYKLIALLRLGVLFNIRRQDNQLPIEQVSVNGNRLDIQFAKNWLAEQPLLIADLENEATQLHTLELHLTFR